MTFVICLLLLVLCLLAEISCILHITKWLFFGKFGYQFDMCGPSELINRGDPFQVIASLHQLRRNPVSFARDAAQLVQGGYHLEWITPVDQFRWSAHVELVAKFSQK